MVQKKRVRSEEMLRGEDGCELTESELASICGGTGGSYSLPGLTNWFAVPQTQSASAKAHIPQDDPSNLKNLDAVSNLTNTLLGSLL